MSLSKQEFTDSGRSMLGRAQAGERLTISKLVAGSGTAGQASELWPLTQPKVQELLFNISTKRDYGQGTLLVEGSFKSSDASRIFLLRELGIMAHIGAEADRLYSIANVFAEPPDNVDPASPSIHTFKVKLIIDRIPADMLTIQIGPTEAVTGENLGADTVGPGVYKEAAGNVLRFKRLVEGIGMEIRDDGDSIYIGVQTLMNDLDLYVPANYPGISDPKVLFPTIQAAHDHLLQYMIPTNKHARIHVYSGHFPQSVPINITHPNASQIEIHGMAVISKTVTGTVTATGTLPNISVNVNVGNTSGIAVNDVVYLYDAPSAQLEGCGVVTSVRAADCTIQMRIGFVQPPASVAALGTTKLIIFPTQLSSSLIGSSPVFNCVTGIGLLKNFGIRSTQPQLGAGVSMNDSGTLENLVATGFYNGFGASNGVINLTSVIAANACQFGCSVGPGGNFHINPPNPVGGWNRLSFNGALNYGIWIVGGSYTGGDGTWTYVCNNQTGIKSDTRGWFGIAAAPPHAEGLICAWNQNGGNAGLGGIIQTAVNAHSIVSGNVANDLIAGSGGQIGLVHNNNNTGNYNPDNNVLGPSGGFISVSTP